jgi:hypothetical protein
MTHSAAAARIAPTNLHDEMGHDVAVGASSRGPEAKRDGRIEMAARNMSDRMGHRQNRQAEGKGHTGKADPEAWKAGGKIAAPHPPNVSQNVPKNSATTRRDVSLFMACLRQNDCGYQFGFLRYASPQQ